MNKTRLRMLATAGILVRFYFKMQKAEGMVAEVMGEAEAKDVNTNVVTPLTLMFPPTRLLLLMIVTRLYLP